MADFQFTDGDGSGDWQDAGNWEDFNTGSAVNSPPGAGDMAYITVGQGELTTDGARWPSSRTSAGRW